MTLTELDKLIELVNDAETNELNIVSIILEKKNESGIGESLIAYVETESESSQGIYCDITDYQSW